MSVGLFDTVVNENLTYDGSYDSVLESDIEERITDDPSTMMEVTGECMLAMMATEAAVAKMEGVNSVRFLVAQQNGDEAAMEAAVVAMEGFLGDVWETLKEWVIKAYKAIKNWLIKVWNKMKGAAGVVQAFFSRYEKVLKNKRVPGCMVDWCRINLTYAREGYEHFDRQLAQLGTIVEAVKNRAQFSNYATRAFWGEERDALHYKHDKDMDYNGAGHAGRNIRDNFDFAIPSPRDIVRYMEQGVYPGGKTDRQVSFEAVRRDAIEAADISTYKKYIDYHLRLGDNGLQEGLKAVNEAKRENSRGSSEARATGSTKLHAYVRRILSAQVSLHRITNMVMATAAKRMQNQSLRACRKAIMFHSTEGDGATPTADSWNNVNGMMAEML